MKFDADSAFHSHESQTDTTPPAAGVEHAEDRTKFDKRVSGKQSADRNSRGQSSVSFSEGFGASSASAPFASKAAAEADFAGETTNGQARETTEARTSARRAKSSLRLKYEAETQVIERKLGDLEHIRATLNLSQRKMAQLLMVDPSAWTRWTKGDDQAPPHIYRMLQWYLALEEKYPALDVNFWLSTVAQVPDFTAKAFSATQRLERRATHLESELQAAQQLIGALERSSNATAASDQPSHPNAGPKHKRLGLIAAFGFGVAVGAFVGAWVLLIHFGTFK